MKKIIYPILFFVLMYNQIAAQSTLFSYNLYRYNPAAAAINYKYASTYDYNVHYIAIPSFPEIFNFNFEKKLTKLHSAIGLNVYTYEIRGYYPLRREVNFSYSYQWKLTKKENSPIIAFGVQSGITNRYLYGPYTPQNPSSRPGSRVHPIFNTGIYFYLPQQQFYMGISVVDILHDSVILNSIPTIFYPTTYQFMSGYRFRLRNNIFLQPNILVKMNQYDNSYSANLHFKMKIWELGLNYHYQSSQLGLNYHYHYSLLGVNAGICIVKRFYVRLAFDFATSSSNNLSGPANSALMLSYRSIK